MEASVVYEGALSWGTNDNAHPFQLAKRPSCRASGYTVLTGYFLFAWQELAGLELTGADLPIQLVPDDFIDR